MLIRAGGVVEGNIVTGKLAIENGAVFRGSCEMPEKEGAPEAKSGSRSTPAPPPPATASPPPSAAAPAKGPGKP